jgi:hypothetical protein
MNVKVKMFLTFLQKSKTLLGVNNQSTVPENGNFSRSVEHSLQTGNANCLSILPDELIKRNEELKETIYGDKHIDSLMYHV